MNKKVFVVLVTYNGAYWIDKNIQSLLQSRYPVSIIAIDNNSTDDSVELLSKYSQVDLIQSPDNLGFGKANNIGMKKALDEGADYVFLLNQDTWVFEGTIDSLVGAMERQPEFGIMSPKHFSRDEITLDAAFETYMGRETKKLNGVPVVPFVNAAAWMMSRKCIETVGYFESLFGHYGEDRNYCDRVAYHKFLIGIDTNSRIVHDRTISRNFKKDVIQSKYKVLSALINPNYSVGKAYIQGLKETLGLPKYFRKFYSNSQIKEMLGELLKYYTGFIVKPGQITAARKRAR